MSPLSSSTGALFEDDEGIGNDEKPTEGHVENTYKDYKRVLAWRNITYMIWAHSVSAYGIYLAYTSAKIMTCLFALLLHYTIILGITAGAHRLWAHRSYKAKWPLKLILMVLHTASFEGHILAWVRDHRVHHKYSDTMADPYGAHRGFFFAHVGWLLVRKHPAVREKGNTLDLSDVESDAILVFQKKHIWILMFIFAVIFPTVIPVYFWNETWVNAFCVAAVLRYVILLHVTFSVNSFAHFYGNKPYDRNITPANNAIISFLTEGEGWHNYHHTFPWDSKASEFGNYGLNVTNAFIEFMAWIGWAYDLKTVSQDVIMKRVQRTGDGSHEVWGWGDQDMTAEDKKAAIITHSTELKSN